MRERLKYLGFSIIGVILFFLSLSLMNRFDNYLISSYDESQIKEYNVVIEEVKYTKKKNHVYYDGIFTVNGKRFSETLNPIAYMVNGDYNAFIGRQLTVYTPDDNNFYFVKENAINEGAGIYKYSKIVMFPILIISIASLLFFLKFLGLPVSRREAYERGYAWAQRRREKRQEKKKKKNSQLNRQ